MPEEDVLENGADLNELLERLLGMVIRRRWWILTPACGAAFATICGLSLCPNYYRSEATLLVVQQRIPERYVVPTTSNTMSDALEGMTRQVLSRTHLGRIIDHVGLYRSQQTGLAPEEIIQLMRKNIEITPLESKEERGSISAFNISFTADDPYKAQQVTSLLTALFIEENLRTRADQSANTTNFLSEQVAKAKLKLAEQEQRVGAFKMQHLGELPEQQQGNLAILGGLQAQLQSMVASLSRAREQRVYLESLLSGYRRLAAQGDLIPGGPGGRITGPIEAVQSDIGRLRSQRDNLLTTYTSQHPDVLRLDHENAQKETLLARLKSPPGRLSTDGEGTQRHGTTGASAVGSEYDTTAVAQVKSQLEANRVEIENLTKDEKRIKTAVEQYQDRLNATPVREQQLAAIVRDYDLMKKNYADLLSKQLQSQLATTLEKGQEGQQFRLVDPPSLPKVPSSPKRVKISLGGLAGGLTVGLALAFLADGRDRCFRAEKEVSQSFSLPLVVAVPLLLTPAEERARTWKAAVEWMAGCLLILAVCVAELYVYRHG